MKIRADKSFCAQGSCMPGKEIFVNKIQKKCRMQRFYEIIHLHLHEGKSGYVKDYVIRDFQDDNIYICVGKKVFLSHR
jgi:hypothetical protein